MRESLRMISSKGMESRFTPTEICMRGSGREIARTARGLIDRSMGSCRLEPGSMGK